jgi:hypothetical protein
VLTPKAPKPSRAKAVEAEKKRVKNIHASASTISTTTNSIASIVGRVARSRALNAVVAATGICTVYPVSTYTIWLQDPPSHLRSLRLNGVDMHLCGCWGCGVLHALDRCFREPAQEGEEMRLVIGYRYSRYIDLATR